MFKTDELCVYEGNICRVISVERKFASGLGYMNIKDGTEFNPTLVLMFLYDENGEIIKKPKTMRCSAGVVEYAHVACKEIEVQMARLQKRLDLLSVNNDTKSANSQNTDGQ